LRTSRRFAPSTATCRSARTPSTRCTVACVASR
jgi:hypothetical protein